MNSQVYLNDTPASTMAALVAAHHEPTHTAANAVWALTHAAISRAENESELAHAWALVLPLLPQFSGLGQSQMEQYAAQRLTWLRRQAARDNAPMMRRTTKGERVGAIEI